MSAVRPTVSIPAWAASSLLSDVSPVTPMLPTIFPSLSRMSTPPATERARSHPERKRAVRFVERDLIAYVRGAVLALEDYGMAWSTITALGLFPCFDDGLWPWR